MNLPFDWSIVLCFLLVTVKDISGQTTPSNAVAEIGGGAILNCDDPSLAINWFMSKDGTTTNQLIIAAGCNVNTNLENHYAVNKTGGPNACNLIVFNVTMDQAGVYSCAGSAVNRAYALLTVLDGSPSITSNATLNVAVENQTVVNTCSLNHNGSVSPAPTLRPHFYWRNSNGLNVNSSYDSTTENTAVSQLTVTAGRQNITSYKCHVYMQLTPSTSPNYANNTPTVSNSASSQPVEVQYSPGNISITSTISAADKCVYKTETLTCAADSNPPAEYSWKDLSNSVTTDGSTTNITSGGEHECLAYNKIGSQTYTDKKVATESTCHPTQNLTINGTNCENNFCTCNGNDSNSKQITIICMANGIPTPSVKWRSENSFDGLSLDGTIGVSLNGNYTCVAFNTYGGKNYSEELTVFVSGCLDASISSTLSSLNVTTTTTKSKPPVGAIAGGIVAGVLVIANVVATCYFCWYYKKVEGASGRKNKLRLDRRFTWLKKMMPCESDTKESTGRKCLWVSLFILLGIVTGIVTFPIWILLANKFEKNTETSALTRRENGEGNGSGENGRGPTNISLANHSQPPPTNQMNAIRQEGPYQNESSRENIELNNSLRSRNLLLPDSQPSRPPPAVRPPPPPNKPTMNLSTNRSKDYAVNDQTQAANPEHTTYADLPFVQRDTLPTASPVQFLNVSNDTYASLNKT